MWLDDFPVPPRWPTRHRQEVFEEERRRTRGGEEEGEDDDA
jgi:hypothetical protein